jgi:hypothetical protein
MPLKRKALRAAAFGVAGLVVNGCSSSGPAAHAHPTPSAVAVGMELWSLTKTSCGTYHYEVGRPRFGGVAMLGSRQRATTIEITSDEPTARRYVERITTEPAGGGITSAWAETGAEVGTHSQGEPAKTMEQLYADCSSQVFSQDRTTNQITFQADDRGAIQRCWYVPNSCVDDCTPFGCAGNCMMGVAISGFACGALDPLPPSAVSCGGIMDHVPVARINVSSSTNSSAIQVDAYCDGSAVRAVVDPVVANGLNVTSKVYQPSSPEVLAFLADLGAAGDLSTISTASDCPKPASFGTVTTVERIFGQPSGDLQCLRNPSAAQAALARDATLLASQD